MTMTGMQRLGVLRLGLIGALALGSASIISAADWPQWRGPQRTATSPETGLLKEWPAAGPRLVWQVKDAGQGFSTPSVVGDRLYLVSNEGLQNEFVRALNVADGKPVWSTRIGKVGNADQQPSYPGARSTPTVDGETMYALGSDGDLVALETRTGRLQWKKSVRTDFGGVPGMWGYAESPLIDGDTLVVTPGGSTALVALNKRTGDVIWKSTVPGAEPAGYCVSGDPADRRHQAVCDLPRKGTDRRQRAERRVPAGVMTARRRAARRTFRRRSSGMAMSTTRPARAAAHWSRSP